MDDQMYEYPEVREYYNDLYSETAEMSRDHKDELINAND